MVLKDGAKMSKSSGNTVDPQPELIDRYGADTVQTLSACLRHHLINRLSGQTRGSRALTRFIKRLWRLAHDVGLPTPR